MTIWIYQRLVLMNHNKNLLAKRLNWQWSQFSIAWLCMWQYRNSVQIIFWLAEVASKKMPTHAVLIENDSYSSPKPTGKTWSAAVGQFIVIENRNTVTIRFLLMPFQMRTILQYIHKYAVTNVSKRCVKLFSIHISVIFIKISYTFRVTAPCAWHSRRCGKFLAK